MTAYFEQLPPHDVQAEESVIASLLVDEDAMNKVAPIVEARDFLREADARTFEACHALWERGDSINQVTVAHELDQRGHLEEIGGLTFLSDLVLNLPTSVGVETWAVIVKRCAVYRSMITAGMKVVQLAYEAGPDLEGALAKAEAALWGLRRALPPAEGYTVLREILEPFGLAPFMEHEQEAEPRVLYAVRSGIRALDAIVLGFRPGQLIVIGAHTSQGKTSLMCNIARNAAVAQNARVAFFTLEMSEEELALRVLAADSRVETKVLERGVYSAAEQDRVMHAIGLLSEAEFYIVPRAELTPARLRQDCLLLMKAHGLDLVIVDYLGLMTPDRQDRNGNTATEVGTITKKLKALASDLDLPIILGSQLNRQNEGQRPVKRDLRDSGSIEQDANIVVFIHREELHTSRARWAELHSDTLGEPYPAGQAELIVAKNRNGPIASAAVRYAARYTKFEDFDPPAREPVQGVMGVE